jgi:hypothetical protein
MEGHDGPHAPQEISFALDGPHASKPWMAAEHRHDGVLSNPGWMLIFSQGWLLAPPGTLGRLRPDSM